MVEKSIDLFFSYAHKDEPFKDELLKHLQLLKREGRISTWHDGMILPGSDWDQEIQRSLSGADIILLLVSPDFLDSDYSWGIEVKKAMQRHEAGEVCVLPVILRVCNWKKAPFAKLQALPKNAEPITKWADRDEAFDDVAQGIELAIEQLLDRRKQSSYLSAQDFQAIFKESLEILPEFKTIEIIFEQAIEKYKNDNRQGAITDLSQVIDLSPEYALAYRWRGYILSKMGEVQKAIEDYSRAIDFDPNDAIAYNNRANIRKRIGDSEGAMADYSKAIKIKPRFAAAYSNRGVLRKELGDLEGAIQDYTEAININPKNHQAYSNRAIAYQQLGISYEIETSSNDTDDETKISNL